MFCPKCGNPDQSPETYCRRCGVFLPDLSKPLKQPVSPEQHIKANTIFSSLTIVACFTLAIMLYTILGFRPDTHWLIYLTASLLLSMGAWHVQTLWRTLLLKRHFNKNKRPDENVIEGGVATGKFLDEPDFENIVPASVADRTTRHLVESPRGDSPQT